MKLSKAAGAGSDNKRSDRLQTLFLYNAAIYVSAHVQSSFGSKSRRACGEAAGARVYGLNLSVHYVNRIVGRSVTAQ